MIVRYQSNSWNATAIKSNDEPETHRKTTLLDLGKTRWAERQNAYTHFHQAYEHIVHALEIVYDLPHDAGYDQNLLEPWSCETKSRASSLLSAIKNFDFIATFCTVYLTLSHLHPVTMKLQSRTGDIIEVFDMVRVTS